MFGSDLNEAKDFQRFAPARNRLNAPGTSMSFGARKSTRQFVAGISNTHSHILGCNLPDPNFNDFRSRVKFNKPTHSSTHIYHLQNKRASSPRAVSLVRLITVSSAPTTTTTTTSTTTQLASKVRCNQYLGSSLSRGGVSIYLSFSACTVMYIYMYILARKNSSL